MNKLTAVIEIPMGSLYKYESKDNGQTLFLDRVNDLRIPYSYGFIEGTHADDGDALDVFVMSEEELQPLSVVDIVPIGVYKCIDNGKIDDKIVAIIKGDKNIYPLEIIAIYLDNYKAGFKRLSYLPSDAALAIIEKTRSEYEKTSHPLSVAAYRYKFGSR